MSYVVRLIGVRHGWPPLWTASVQGVTPSGTTVGLLTQHIDLAQVLAQANELAQRWNEGEMTLREASA